jgi:hypothetical protein
MRCMGRTAGIRGLPPDPDDKAAGAHRCPQKTGGCQNGIATDGCLESTDAPGSAVNDRRGGRAMAFLELSDIHPDDLGFRDAAAAEEKARADAMEAVLSAQEAIQIERRKSGSFTQEIRHVMGELQSLHGHQWRNFVRSVGFVAILLVEVYILLLFSFPLATAESDLGQNHPAAMGVCMIAY